MVLQLVSGFVYASVLASWLATSRLRSSALAGSHALLSIALRGALQLLVSLLLSIAIYHSLYHALVPPEERSHPAYFGACTPSPTLHGADACTLPEDEPAHRQFEQPAFSPTRSRLAELWFKTNQLAEHDHKLLPTLPPGWVHSAHMCLTMPESPANVAAGTFHIEFALLSASNHTLVSDSRPMLLRYKSPLLRWLWVAAYALPLLLGLSEEAQTHCLEVSQAQPTSGLILSLHLSIPNPKPQPNPKP